MLERIQDFDDFLLGIIQDNLHNIVLDIVMPFLSTLGNLGFIWIVTAVVLICLKKYRAVGITLLVALLLCLLIGNLGLKPLIARPRPCWVNPEVFLLIPNPTDYSFPSGHTLASFAAATVLFWHSKRLGFCALFVASLIAFSRLYLYVHYPTDVLGGILIGVGIGLTAVFLYRTISRHLQDRKSAKPETG